MSTRTVTMRRRSLFLVPVALLLALIGPPVASAGSPGTGAVFTLSNRRAMNTVLVWERAANGDLTAVNPCLRRHRTGTPSGSQGL